jgi:hypothetical protein
MMVDAAGSRSWAAVLLWGPVVSSLAPLAILIAVPRDPADNTMSPAVLLVQGALPLVGAVVAIAFARLRLGGRRIEVPLVPYALVAVLYAVGSWVDVLTHERGWTFETSGREYGGFESGLLIVFTSLPVFGLVGGLVAVRRASRAQR